MNSEILDLLRKRYPNLKYSEAGGYNSFSSPEKEYDLLRWGAALRDISSKNFYRIKGKDILQFLNRLSTNTTTLLDPLSKVNTLFLNEDGNIIDRATILHLENELLLIGSDDKQERLSYWINRFITDEDVSLEKTDEYFLLEILGPQAGAYMTMIFGSEINDFKENEIKDFQCGDVHVSCLINHEKNDIAKYWIVVRSEDAVSFLNYLYERRSVLDCGFVGEEIYETFRIERGIVKFPNELNDLVNPCEAGLTNEIDPGKKHYIGYASIRDFESNLARRRTLMGVVFEDGAEVQIGSKIYDDGRNELGRITSFGKSLLINKRFGLAVINKNLLNEDTELLTEVGAKSIPVTVCSLPLSK